MMVTFSRRYCRRYCTATIATGSTLLNRTISNTAFFTSTNAGFGSATAAFRIADIRSIYLPLVSRDL